MDRLEILKLVLEGLTELLHRHQDDPVKCNRINLAIAEFRAEADSLKGEADNKRES